MANKGWIKIHREILDNPTVCKDADFFAVWVYLLLSATHDEYDVEFLGKRITLKSGQLITGRKSISLKFNIDENKVTRILKRLESEQQIEQQTGNKNRLITVLKWGLYQNSEQQIEQQVNNNRTTSEQQVNTNKNVKNIKNDKEYVKREKQSRFTPPTQEEVKSYCLERNNKVDVSKFIDFYESKGWMVGKNKMKDWKACIRTWEKSDIKPKSKNSFNNIPESAYGDMMDLERDILAN